MHSPKSSIPASISFWQTLPFFRPQFQHQLYTSGWQNLSFHPAHSNCCSIFFRIGAKLGFVFNVALAMRNFTMTADTFLAEAQATPYLQKMLVETRLWSWVANPTYYLPKRRDILKYVVHKHMLSIWVGFFCCFVFLEQKSHIFSSWFWAGRKNFNNVNTVEHHSCPTCTRKICPNCRLVGFTNPPELL